MSACASTRPRRAWAEVALAVAVVALAGSAAETDPIGESFQVPRPYAAGAITMDKRTMSRRLYRDMNVAVEDADRDLAQETLHARLPAGYDPAAPAGLLVWSSPSPDGRVPRVFGPALDELGLVCIGIDGAGNDRDVPDKFQLVFDAIATARERFDIDPERVYIAGFSGGAKVASILTITFPDVFAGAVPIAGFATYSTLDEATWGRHHMGYFAKPAGSRLRQAQTRPIALVSGPPDFNYDEMEERRRLLEADGFDRVRFFAYPDMAHHLPTAERFTEALRWVVGGERQQRHGDTEAAQKRTG